MQGRHIVIVEDDAVDAKALKRAFTRRLPGNQLYFAKDGFEALDLLRRPGGIPEPRLMLLDLNMPRMGGLELLQELRKDPGLKDFKVCALTTSRNSTELFKAQSLGVLGYLVKEDMGTSYDLLFNLLERLCGKEKPADS